MRQWALAVMLICTILSGCAHHPVQSSPTGRRTIDVVAFPSTATVALYVGVDQGFYEAAGLDVRLFPTPSSQQLVQGLVSGKYQFGAALIDNFVAYRANQHAVPRDPEHDLRVVMGLASARVALVSRGDIQTVSELRDRKVGIDAPGTGFAFVLYHMLSQHGLSGSDVRLIQSGSTKARWAALERGELDATMLTPEFAVQAQTKGFRILQDSARTLPDYMGLALAAEEKWIARNRATVRDFLRATVAAREWLAQPENRSLAAASLSRELGGTQQQMLELLEQLLANDELIENGQISEAGLATVLSLRRQFGDPATVPMDPAQYLDLSHLPRPAPDLQSTNAAR